MSMTLEEIGEELEKVRDQLDELAEQLKETVMIDHSIALEIKRNSHRSFRNFRDAARHLQGKSHEPFGTYKVQNASLGYTRKIERDAGMTLSDIERWAENQMPYGK